MTTRIKILKAGSKNYFADITGKDFSIIVSGKSFNSLISKINKKYVKLSQIDKGILLTKGIIIKK